MGPTVSKKYFHSRKYLTLCVLQTYKINPYDDNAQFFCFTHLKITKMLSNYSNAMTAMTARACDSCIRKRARWYCAADDAFLCQSCDGSVHSANPLARRHERVKLKNTSVDPPWTTGFTRKPRTPRRKNKCGERVDPVDELVPEIGVEETNSYDEMSDEVFNNDVMFEVPFIGFGDDNDCFEFDEFGGGDVESLLGFDMEDLGLDESMEGSSGSGRVKFEKEEDLEIETHLINANNFGNYPLMVVKESSENFEVGKVKKKVLLALDYDGVIAAWAGDRSPWTTGDRPVVDPTDTWPNFPGNKGMIYYTFGDHETSVSGQAGAGGLNDGGREARVSRYREKRRNRLFSKKIRYEVRKLNAEKRPRMKGRFVKRSNFASPAPPQLTLLNK